MSVRWLMRLFALFSVSLLYVPAVLATGSEQLIQPIMTEMLAVPDKAAGPVRPGALLAFLEHPYDLQSVVELNKNSAVILRYAEQRLASKNPVISIDEAGELMIALSLLEDEHALSTLLTLAERYNRDTAVSQQVLLMLRDMPVTEPVLAYVDTMVKLNRTNPDLVRSALLYYLAVKHDAGMRWAAVYRSPGVDPQIRFAGLALAASLIRDDQVTRWILNELTKQPAAPGYQQYYLLEGLYASVTEAEFDQLLPRFTVSPVTIKEFQRLRDFNRASGAEKTKLAGFMLASPFLDQHQAAIKYFLEQRSLMELWPRLSDDRKLSAIRLSQTLGISILPEPEVSNEPVADQAGLSPAYVLGLILLIVLVLAFTYRRMRLARSLRVS